MHATSTPPIVPTRSKLLLSVRFALPVRYHHRPVVGSWSFLDKVSHLDPSVAAAAHLPYLLSAVTHTPASSVVCEHRYVCVSTSIGSQRVGAGLDIVRAFPYVKQLYDEADEALKMPLSQLIWHGQQVRTTTSSQHN